MSHPVVPDQTGPDGERVIGIIDLGSNSLRLMLVRILPDGSHTVLNQVKNMVRLGEGAFETGHLREESMARTINVLRGMAEMCGVYGASEVIAIATAAVRDAANGPDFMRRVKEKTGIDFRVVSGREEARLIYLGVSSGLAHTESLRLFIDIGGGSTELVVGNSEEYRNLDSLKMGCVRLSNLFFDKDSGTISAKRYAALQNYIRNNALRSFQRIADFVIEEAVASSGTAQNLAEIAAALFEQCCGAEVCPGTVDVYPMVVPAPVIDFRPDRARMLCGADVPDDFMVQRLSRLGCKVEPAADGHLTVTAPTNRPDLTREVDLIEEVCRLWGEGDITPTLPAAKNHAGGLTVDQRRVRLIGQTLRACGLSETSTYCFADPSDLVKLGITDEGRGIPVKIINPLVADQSQMRQSMLPGLLRSVAYNLDHGVPNVALYEIGRVFYGHEGKSQPDEPSFVAGVLAGKRADDAWNQKYAEYDFFDAKGSVEALLDALRLTKVRFKVADPEQYPWLQPGRAAEVLSQGQVIGWVGNIHPASLQKIGVDEPVVAFELSVEHLLRLAKKELPYVDVPTLPGVTHDLAIVVDESVTYEQLVQRITSAGGKLLADVRLFDVYRDPVRVGKGKKSMAFSLTYRAADRTLTSEEVEKAHEKLVKKVLRATGGEVRS